MCLKFEWIGENSAFECLCNKARFKVGNTIDVEQRVVAALPAVPLQHLVQVPTAIPVRSGVSYFEIEPNNDLYQRMLDAESICIYIPAGFQDIAVELIVVMNGQG